MLYLAKISGERLQDHWSSGLTKQLEQVSVLIKLFWFHETDETGTGLAKINTPHDIHYHKENHA